jgi:zinc transport system ATP-binding protein
LNKKKLIEVQNISFKYRRDFVLKDINFNLTQGDFFAITGPNGGGKSTLIKLILGLLKPTIGTIKLNHLKNSDIGYVPQNTNINLDFPITVLDVVMMGNGAKHNNKKFFHIGYSSFETECAKHSLAKVGMSEFLKNKIADLSGGQRQRVMIARAICSHPKLLVLDEPTSNIDVYGQKEIYKLLKELNKDITILVVTHDLTVISNYANKVLYINQTGYMHNLKDNNFKIDNKEHFCEVELMQMLGSKNE